MEEFEEGRVVSIKVDVSEACLARGGRKERRWSQQRRWEEGDDESGRAGGKEKREDATYHML